MSTVKSKRERRSKQGKRSSFRDLKAFGMWADRDDVRAPVRFTKRIRSQMERSNKGR